METTGPINKPINEIKQFDSVRAQILNVFEPLIQQLIERRDTLLKKLQEMRNDYEEKVATRKSAITELEKIQQQLQDMHVKLNPNFQFHEQATEVYKQGIEQLSTPTKPPHPMFSCATLLKLKASIAEFGEVKEWEMDYSQKKETKLAIRKVGKAKNELDVRGLAIDEFEQLVYIVDHENAGIQVVSFKGNFIKRFGKEILKKPWGITVTKDSILVTDVTHHALLQFKKADYKLMKGTGVKGAGEGQLYYPHGLCTDVDENIFVADNINHRVSVFTKDLEFLKHFGTHQLIYPHDVKATQNKILVLDWSPNCFHFFSRSGDLLNSCATQGEDGLVFRPFFFCLDIAENILITDYQRHDIKVLSASGELITRIGKEGNGRGELTHPYGIGIDEMGDIFVISSNNNFCLQSF